MMNFLNFSGAWKKIIILFGCVAILKILLSLNSNTGTSNKNEYTISNGNLVHETISNGNLVYETISNVHQQKQYMNQSMRDELDMLNRKRVSMDDPRLIRHIRDYWLEPPSSKPYNLTNPKTMDPSIGQAGYVDNRLEYKENGFFVESGALDGELKSNTLLFERYRKWSGLLIEADPSNYKLVKEKNRKAYTINACLSPHPYPAKLKFEPGFHRGQLTEGNRAKPNSIEIQCFPLYSILLALNIKHVDFFSLDVEGAEMLVLKTIPFDKVYIKTMAVEYFHIKPEGEMGLKKFVESKGYVSLMKMSHYRAICNDIIFGKNMSDN